MKRMLNITITSTATYLAMILMNPIITQYAISNVNIYNPKLINAKLIKLNLNNRFIMLHSILYN